MTRKESEKDSERPHYYSQFWLDVAAGRKIISAPKTSDETDAYDSELEPIVLHKPDRHGSAAISDDYEETIAHPEVEPEFDADEFAEPELDEVELENEVEEEEEIPNIILEEAEIPDIVLAPFEEEIVEEVPLEEIEEEEEFFDEEEEEEDDLEWNVGRGRKKPKPRGVAAKLPPKLPPKKAKREPRRGF